MPTSLSFFLFYRVKELDTLKKTIVKTMFYKKYYPVKALQPFIHCYYLWESDHSFSKPLLIESPPSGFASVVFNYGDNYMVNIEGKTKDIPPPCFFSGQAIQRYQLQLRGKIGMVGIVFNPAGLASLFKLPMHEFVEKRISAELLFGKETPFLLEQIYEVSLPNKKISIIENQLIQQLKKKEIESDSIDFASNLIVQQNGQFKMDNLLDKVFMSRRQFERKFLKRTGLSSKYYARIRRLANLCKHAIGQENINWQWLIGESGYYDQAHFIKDFQEFMGTSPTDYYAHHEELIRYLET